MRVPQRNIFDTDYTYLLKWIPYFESTSPTRLIHKSDKQPSESAVKADDGFYYDIPSHFNYLVEKKLSLKNIFKRLHASPYDFIMLAKYNDIEVEKFAKDNFPEGVSAGTYFIDNFKDENLDIEVQLWEKNLVTEIEKQLEELSTIEERQNKLQRLYDETTLEFTQPLYESVQVYLDFTKSNGSKLTPDYGIDVFNSAVLSNKVPFIQYNSRKEKYVKITSIEGFNYERIAPDIYLNATENVYIVVFNSRADEWQLVGIDLSTASSSVELKFSSENMDTYDLKDDFFQLIHTSLPSIHITKMKESDYSAIFKVVNPEGDVVLENRNFISQIFFDPMYSSYFYIDETNKTLAEKEEKKLMYKYVVSDEEIPLVKFRELILDTDNSYTSQKDGKSIEVNKDSVILEVKIKKIINKEKIDNFQRILTALLHCHIEGFGVIDDWYLEYGIELPQVEEEKEKEKKDTKISMLKKEIPELFAGKSKKGNLYSRACSAERQPSIKTATEVKGLEKNTYVEFPENSGVFFSCADNKDVPYVGLVKNKGENMNKYPLLPCCFKEDQSEKMKGKLEEKKTTHLMKEKDVFNGEKGECSLQLNYFLTEVTTEGNSFLRLGVPQDVNSLIHCVLESLQDPDYTSVSKEEKNMKVKAIRYGIFDFGVYPELMKQELFDHTLDEIKGKVRSNSFFDSRFYYRALEESFNVNIIVFTEEPMSFEVPRYKSMPIRKIDKKRKSVLVIRRENHYELLIEVDSSRKVKNKIFGSEMSNLIANAYAELVKTYSWNYDYQSLLGNRIPELIDRENVFDIDIREYLESFQVEMQYIDNNGKMRAVNFVGRGGKFYTLIVPPSQPLNLPFTEEFVKNTPKDILDTLGRDVTAFDYYSLGFWYPIFDIKYGVYVPSTEVYQDLPQGPFNPVVAFGMSAIDNITTSKKKADFLKQIVNWIYDIEGQNTSLRKYFKDVRTPPLGVKEFMRKYFIFKNTDYNISKLQRHLPHFESVEEGLRYLSTNKGFVEKGKMIISNERMANLLELNLKKYIKETDYLDLPVERYLHNFYVIESDFKQQPGVYVFIGRKKLDNWSRSMREEHTFYDIVFRLRTNIHNESPYIFQTSNGDIYQVQNVKDGDYSRAVYNSWFWNESKMNYGYNIQEPKGELPSPKVYTISPSGDLKFLRGEGDNEVLELDNKGVPKYVSLMKIL